MTKIEQLIDEQVQPFLDELAAEGLTSFMSPPAKRLLALIFKSNCVAVQIRLIGEERAAQPTVEDGETVPVSNPPILIHTN